MKTIIIIVISLNLANESIAQEMNLAKADSLKLLVVTGGPSLRAQIDLVPTSFYSLFSDFDNLTWDHATHDEAGFQSESFDSYDVVLMYNRSDSISDRSKQKLKKHLESGKGLIVLHHALGSYNNWEWWWKEVVGGKYQMVENTKFKKSAFKPSETIDVITKKNHPITREIGDFKLYDETYINLWLSDDIEVIYQTDNPTSDGPLVWISPYKKSRVVAIQPGHAKSAHQDMNYKKLIYQAIQWVNNKEE